MKDVSQQVAASRKAFDAILGTPQYREVHGDADHLERLLKLLDGGCDGQVLDLGTGDGYVAFAMAKRWPECSIVGLDVAPEAVARNRMKVVELGLTNVEFHTYEGVEIPFSSGRFSGAICRYAFHHCPQPEVTVAELARVLNEQGFLVLSDPVPSPRDEGGFIETFQTLHGDGHHCFHPEESLVSLFEAAGFERKSVFKSSFRGPRTSDSQYEGLLAQTSKAIRDAYDIQIQDGRIIFTLMIMNHLFEKC